MSKYNATKTVVDGNTFDSKAEGDYYILLLKLKEEGHVKSFSLQPKFMLQDGFKKEGKVIRPIYYIADFDITYDNGFREIVDVKGMETATFKIKRKLFEKRYPYKLTLVKYVKKYGGWITLEAWKDLKKQEKKVSK